MDFETLDQGGFPRVSKRAFRYARKIGGSVVGIAIIAVDSLAPHWVLDLLAIINAPTDLHKLWVVITWSSAHFALWAPLVIGLAVICWANWEALNARVPSNRLLRAGIILLLLVVSYFIPLEKYADQTPRHVGYGGEGAQYAPGIGSGGKGGDVKITGDRSNGGGGGGGLGSVDCVGGAGGNVEIQGEGSSGVGGAGGNCWTPDGRGGRRTVSPAESANLPTELWAYGYGGQGANKPEYDRRLRLLKQIRSEYVKKFPAEVPFIEAGVDPVPISWVNKRLEELGEKWRVTIGDGGYVMPPLRNR
jgi:hypothetical protein